MSAPGLPSHGDHPLNEREQALFELSEKVFEHARETGVESIELDINQVAGAEYTVRNGEPETIERNQDKGLELRVFIGNRTGSASSTDFSDQAIASTVRAAAAIARVTEADSCQRLAPSELYPAQFPDLELHHPHGFSTEEISRFALEQAGLCEAAALSADGRISNTEGASFSAHEGVALKRNSEGFTGFSRGTRYGLSCSVIATGNNAMERDYWYDSKRRLDRLEPAAAIGATAAERATRRLDARKLDTCRAPVVFDASIAPGLLRHLVSALSGNAIYKKASFLVDQLDQQLFPDSYSVIQEPHLAEGLGSAVWDADGVATQTQSYIDQGVLRQYILGQYSACKLGMQTTGNAGGVRNLSISHEDISQAELLQRMDRGLLVTEVMGFGVNTVTGDYSRGAAGFWIENGQVQYPVHEITLSGHLTSMYRGIEGISSDTNVKGNLRSGSILINEMTIGGN